MKQKILIVDDDASICEILEFNLKSEGYLVESAYSAEEAVEKLDSSFSLLILDVMMGGISGYKMAAKLREGGNFIPIIFLTAKDEENDMLTGFSVGGDDYISKPFSIKEVLARVKAILSRSFRETEKSQPLARFGEGMVIDFEKKELFIDNSPVSLTKTEYSILELLSREEGYSFSRSTIIDKVWGVETYITKRTVDVHIARLRKKLGDYASLISSRPGFGYKFEEQLP